MYTYSYLVCMPDIFIFMFCFEPPPSLSLIIKLVWHFLTLKSANQPTTTRCGCTPCMPKPSVFLYYYIPSLTGRWLPVRPSLWLVLTIFTHCEVKLVKIDHNSEKWMVTSYCALFYSKYADRNTEDKFEEIDNCGIMAAATPSTTTIDCNSSTDSLLKNLTQGQNAFIRLRRQRYWGIKSFKY